MLQIKPNTVLNYVFRKTCLIGRICLAGRKNMQLDVIPRLFLDCRAKTYQFRQVPLVCFFDEDSQIIVAPFIRLPLDTRTK